MPGVSEKPFVEILLVEDSAADADLMIEALKDGRLNSRVIVVDDGVEAMDLLRKQGKFASHVVPDLILLDLYLPRMSGKEVLEEVKADALLRRIPVVILTSSENEQDFIDAYGLHANCCVRKPANQEEFGLAVQKIEHFWLHVARRARS